MISLSKRNPMLLEVAEEVTILIDSLEAIDCNPELDEAAKEKAREELNAIMKPALEGAVRKVDQFGHSLTRAKAEIAYLKAEEERICARRKSLEAGVDWLKDYAHMVLAGVPGRKLGGRVHTLRLQANSISSVEVPDPMALPPEFELVTIRLTRAELVTLGITIRPVGKSEPDNAAIRAIIEAGGVVPGASLVRGEHVRCS